MAELMLVPSETSWAISNMKCQATAVVKNHDSPVNWTLNSKILFSQVWWQLAVNPRTQEAGTVDLCHCKASLVYKESSVVHPLTQILVHCALPAVAISEPHS